MIVYKFYLLSTLPIHITYTRGLVFSSRVEVVVMFGLIKLWQFPVAVVAIGACDVSMLQDYRTRITFLPLKSKIRRGSPRLHASLQKAAWISLII